MHNLFAITLDLSMNQLLEKGIAVFLLVVFGKRLKSLEKATDRQTQMFYECITWLGELIRHDKKQGPPTSPGLPHMHQRRNDIPPDNGSTPTPKPPSKPDFGVKL